MTTTVVVGNPKPESRTLAAAVLLAERLSGGAPDHVIDLIDLGAGLLGWGDDNVASAVRTVQSSSLVVFGSPTYKGTYTGLLKLFLEQFPGGTGLAGVVTVPFMLGGSPDHALAADLTLKPVLTQLGGTCALPGLYLLDQGYAENPALATYTQRWRPTVEALAGPAGHGASR
ncbi:NADPH-dependent FMN reductase [Rhodococcus pyridinivorans KG-16]|uniref:NADPH-dependent FMN reductase n=1 Tax=Rhodococcus pyridinivorans KG-16 TaxID=1441730 RepID=A0A0V9UD86_9NOCA|nr:NAD(P)H-dependent oxidoreductase [Rhodococcus pyridinivorans]KSZ56078.1 NADPH-dependent FMN reductase [Rhodococcus pyridinivorans KG-16]